MIKQRKKNITKLFSQGPDMPIRGAFERYYDTKPNSRIHKNAREWAQAAIEHRLKYNVPKFTIP